MKLIRELTENIKYEKVLDESTNTKKWHVSGITLVGDTQNKNKRIYPMGILEKAVADHKKNYLDSHRALGELNHPTEGMAEINLENVSHKFISVEKDSNAFFTKAEVLNTPKGLITQNLLEAEVQLGISSRGLGNIKNSGGQKIISEYHIVSYGDIVADPSAPGAWLSGILESKEWVWENGILVEKDLSEDIDKYKKSILEADKSQIESAILTAFNDYFRKILS